MPFDPELAAPASVSEPVRDGGDSRVTECVTECATDRALAERPSQPVRAAHARVAVTAPAAR